MKQVNLTAKINNAVHELQVTPKGLAKGMLEAWYNKWSKSLDDLTSSQVSGLYDKLNEVLTGPDADELHHYIEEELNRLLVGKVLLNRDNVYIKVKNVSVSRDYVILEGPCCQVDTCWEGRCVVNANDKYIKVPLFIFQQSPLEGVYEIPPRELSGMLTDVRKQAERNIKNVTMFVELALKTEKDF